MAKMKWEVDSYTIVELQSGALFAKHRVFLNGREVATSKPKQNITIPFLFSDGRTGEITLKTEAFRQEMELRVNGELVLSDLDKRDLSCMKCGEKAAATAKFCGKCGSEMPKPEDQKRIQALKAARGAIAVTAVMFALSGIILYFVQSHQNKETFSALAQYQDDQVLPNQVGTRHTAGEARAELRAAPISILALNFFLGAIMLGLFFYAKHSPSIAIFTAAGVYLSVQVVNGVIDPRSISNGMIMKVVIITMFIRGIRSTLELRKQHG